EDVVAEDETEGVRTRPPLVLEEFDGGVVVPVAHVEPCHEEARVSEGVLRHLPPSVQEAVQAPRIRRAGIEYEGRIVERVLGEIHRLRGEGVRKGRAVPEGEFGEGSDGLALGELASQASLEDLGGLPKRFLLLSREPEGRHLVCMHAQLCIYSFRGHALGARVRGAFIRSLRSRARRPSGSPRSVSRGPWPSSGSSRAPPKPSRTSSSRRDPERGPRVGRGCPALP